MSNHLLQPLGVSGPVVTDELRREGTQGFAFFDRPSAFSVADRALLNRRTSEAVGSCPAVIPRPG